MSSLTIPKLDSAPDHLGLEQDMEALLLLSTQHNEGLTLGLVSAHKGLEDLGDWGGLHDAVSSSISQVLVPVLQYKALGK